MVGCGGICGSSYFHREFPEFLLQRSLHINALELLTIIVCLKLWGSKGKRIAVYCDNLVSVQVINQGKSRSCFLQACLREICFLCAILECEIRAVHISGVENRIPDLLSRWNIAESYQSEFLSLTSHLKLFETFADENLFRFQHDW